MKQKIYGSFYLFLVLQLWCFNLAAQLYPVQLNPVLLPPYTLNTSDYYNSNTEKLAIVLNNTDLQKPVLGVRLRMFIEGQNAKLQSREGVYYPTINLEAGIPTRISLRDLAPYFNADNLNFQGITRAMYVKDGKLPEGFYQFCFEAVEVSTGQVVSRKSCTMAWITLNDPPFLNLPIKGESVASREVQNLVFQWTPRNMGSPNGAFNTEYEFTLKELWDTGIAPEAAFSSTQSLYQTTVRQTTLLMGPAEPLLIPGKRYAWRVRAISTSASGEQSDGYRNNGFSEIFWFTYQSNCKAPLGITASINSGRATISWQNDLLAGIPSGGYTVQYREHTLSGNNTWYSLNTLQPRVMLYDLKPGTTYEYRIGSQCDASNSGMMGAGATYSDILTLVMSGNPNDGKTINCGMISPEISIVNKTSIASLAPGDIITAGDFPVKLTEVTGGGSFSGQGYVTIPMLGYVNVKVRFANIGVNTDRQLYSGVIETTYDPKEGQIKDLDKTIEGGYGTGVVRTGIDTADYQVNFPIKSIDDLKVELKDKDGKAIPEGSNTPATSAIIQVHGPGGKTETIQADKIPTTIKDSEGTVYEVKQGKDGKPVVSKLSEKVPMKMDRAALNTLASNQGEVRFVPYLDKQIYAFDEYQSIYGKSTLFKGAYEKLGDKYYVNAKVILPGKTDYVKAVVNLKDPKLIADSIQFITAKGNKLERIKLADGSYEIVILGGPANDAQELYAVYPQSNGKYLSLGKLLIASYPPKTYKVQLVPVIVEGKTSPQIGANSIAEKLNKIYGPIGVNFTVSKAADFANESWDLNGDKSLAVKGSNWLSNQTAEMKALNKAYKAANPGLAKDMVTLFVLNSADSTGNVKGDMPRGTAFGYLFDGANDNTAAHEVGHGIFKLRHTFDSFGYREGEMVGNLMDYPPGEQLTKFQWDAVHAPGIVVDIFEKDEDSKDITVSNMDEIYKRYGEKGKLTFLAPSGQPITIKEKIKEISFSNFEDTWFKEKFDKDVYLPIGALQSFTLADGKRYAIARPEKSVSTPISISGYCRVDSTSNCIIKYVDSESRIKLNSKIVVGFLAIEKSFPVFKIYGVDNNKFVFTDIPAKNIASGIQKPLFYIANFIDKSDLTIASTMKQIDFNGLMFINQFGGQNIEGISALYILRMAHFLKEIPQLNNCLGVVGQGVVSSASTSYNQKIINDRNSNNGNTGIKTTIPFFESTSITDVLNSPKYLPQLHNMLERMYITLSVNKNVVEALPLKDISDIVDILSLDDRAERACLLRNIPMDIRMQIIRKHIEGTMSNSKEMLISDLLDYINDSDVPQLLDELEGKSKDYALYWSLYKDQYFQADKDRLAGILSNHIINLKRKEIAGLNKSITPESPKYINLCKENVIDALIVPICDVSSTQQGKDFAVKIVDISNALSTEKISDSYKGSPFDLVKVVFTSDFQFPTMDGKKIKKGDSTVVPLLWLDWLINKQENTTNWTLVRIGADAVAVAAAIATVQPELVVIVDGALAAGDVVVQLSSDKLRSTYNGNHMAIAFLDGWDQLYAVYGGVRLGQIVLNPRTWTKAVENLKASGKSVKDNAQLFYDLYKIVKNSNGNLKVIADKGKDAFGNILYRFAIETELADHCSRSDEIVLAIQGKQFVVGIKATLQMTGNAIADFSLAENSAKVSSLTLSNLIKLPKGIGISKTVQTITNIKAIGYTESITLDVVLASDGKYYVANVIENKRSIISLVDKLTGDDIKYRTSLENDLRGSNELLTALTDKPNLLNEWLLMEKAGSKLSKLNPDYLNRLGLLNQNVKSLVLTFSDKPDTRTLAKFLDDCNPGFVDFLNEVDNFPAVKAMVMHKLSADEVEVITEIVPDGDEVLTKAKKWIDRSENINKFMLKTAEGVHYGKRAAKDLLSPNSIIAQKLGIDMNDYYLFRELQLWVNVAKTEYMVADIVLVRYNADKKIIDLIILECKLSGGTDNTKRQRQGFEIIAEGRMLEVKAESKNQNFDNQNFKLLGRGLELKFERRSSFKVSDSGSKDGGFDVNQIKFKDIE